MNFIAKYTCLGSELQKKNPTKKFLQLFYLCNMKEFQNFLNEIFQVMNIVK